MLADTKEFSDADQMASQLQKPFFLVFCFCGLLWTHQGMMVHLVMDYQNLMLSFSINIGLKGLLVLFSLIYSDKQTSRTSYNFKKMNISFDYISWFPTGEQATSLQPITFMMNQTPQIKFKKPKTLDIDLVKANPFYKEEKPSCVTYTSKFESKVCLECCKILFWLCN